MPTQTVDLGDEGLTDGDDISPYIDQHWNDGVEVLIPAGDYDYDGSGLHGQRGDCSLIGSEEGVRFHRPDGARLEPFTRCTHGTMRVENITVRGVKPSAPNGEGSKWRFDATDPDARIEVVNVNHPDGSADNSDANAFYTGNDHRGVVEYKNCFIGPHGNSAIYANVGSEGAGADAPVIVDNCVFIDPNNAIRVGHNGSEYRNITVVWRNPPRTWADGNALARGFRLDDPHAGDDITIENCHFYFGADIGSARGAIEFENPGAFSGVVRDVFVHTEGDYGGLRDVDDSGDSIGGFTFENINSSGPGAPITIDKAGVSQASTPPDLRNEDALWMTESQTVKPGGVEVTVPETLVDLTVDSVSSVDFDYRMVVDGYLRQHETDLEDNDDVTVLQYDPLRMEATGRTGSNKSDVWQVNGTIGLWELTGGGAVAGQDFNFVYEGQTSSSIEGVTLPTVDQHVTADEVQAIVTDRLDDVFTQAVMDATDQ